MSSNSKTPSMTHLNTAGEAYMVDVSDKAETARQASASAKVILSQEVLKAVFDGELVKGDVLAVARIAGIQATKKCSELIPLCHPLPITKATLEIEQFSEGEKRGVEVVCTCKTTGKTGVEMEALTGASVAALTIYDMCKAIDKGIVIESVRLLHKTGGKSGDWFVEGENQ